MRDSQLSRRLVIKQGTLIDGSGSAPRANDVLVIDCGRIVAVGAAECATIRPIDAADAIIDASGQFILPGLIDGHVHLSSHQGALPGVRHTSTPEFAAVWTARAVHQIIGAGVTGISVPGGKFYVDLTIRDCIDGGLLTGPRVFCAGRALTPFGGIFDDAPLGTDSTLEDSVGLLCHSRDDYARETRRQCRDGVNLIKIADSYWGDTQTVSEEDIRTVVDVAHRHGAPVCIHSRGSGSTRAAARAGVDWIFHADLATEHDLDAVAEAGVPIMPVFTQTQRIADHWESLLVSRRMRDRAKAQLDINYETIRKARARGIEILCGTDSGNAATFEYGRHHARELELLVREIGFTPMEAIVAATRLNAKTIGLHGKVGTLAAGQLADVVVWKSDPVKDITVLQKPEQIAVIIKQGEIVDCTRTFRSLPSEPPRARLMAQG